MCHGGSASQTFSLYSYRELEDFFLKTMNIMDDKMSGPPWFGDLVKAISKATTTSSQSIDDILKNVCHRTFYPIHYNKLPSSSIKSVR